MRFGRISLGLLTMPLALLLANTAFGNSVTMTYEGHQGVVAQNGSPYIGYPYYFSINGSSSFTYSITKTNRVAVGPVRQPSATTSSPQEISLRPSSVNRL